MKTVIILAMLCVLIMGNSYASKKATLAQLTKSYEQFRQAMLQKNLKLWQFSTSTNHQVKAYNHIVSRRKSFRQSIFQVPANVYPNIKKLKRISFKQNADVAQLIYFGVIGSKKAKEGLIILTFHHEQNSWKYHHIAFVSLANIPQVRTEISQKNYRFLQQKKFALAKSIPQAPPLVKKIPDVAAQLAVHSYGYNVTVTINGRSYKVDNDKNVELIIGGMQFGKNKVTVQVSPLIKGKYPAFGMAIYGMSHIPGNKPIVLFKQEFKNKEITNTQSFRYQVTVPASIQPYLYKHKQNL